MSLRAKTKYVPAARPAVNAGVTLFCSNGGLGCHWIRMVLAEKELEGAQIQFREAGRVSEDLIALNPTGSLPTLLDRDAVVYPARLIAEFLDERYPHPPMMPPEPALRARLRMVMQHIEQDYFVLVDTIAQASPAQARALRKRMADQLVSSSRLFPARGWFMGLEFGIVDCAWSALLWRLSSLGLSLPAGGEALRKYAERAFGRPRFAASLSEPQRAAVRRQKP
jgi:RNA polymerase-associated protein